MTCAKANTLNEKMDLHNQIVKLKKGIVENIKKKYPNKTDAVYNRFVKIVLEKNKVPDGIQEIQKAQVVTRQNTNGNNESQVDIYAIEKLEDGYRLLYVTPKTNTAKVVKVGLDGRTENAKYDIDSLTMVYISTTI